jgi:hypothetical protein
MTRRTKLVEELKAYFTEKGKFLQYHEYIEQDDKPYRPQLIKRVTGTWTRLERMIGEITPAVEEPKKVEPPKEKPPTPEKK